MSRKVLLVVDDEPRMRSFVRDALATEALQIQEGASGLDALELTQDVIPDLILLDLHMPRMDGFKTLELLRGRPWLDGTPIVIVTVERDGGSVTRAVRLGADDYLAKPFALGDLEEKVSHWLAMRRTP